MTPNNITLARIMMSFGIIIIFQLGFYWGIAALLLTLIVFYMDALDGYVARKLGVASEFGALFDITGDRIVEHVYWIFFTTIGMVSMWVPIIFISRSFMVDTVRYMAFSKEGKMPFGEKSMMRSKFTLFLTSSRFMRGFYGIIKVFVFLLLGALVVFKNAGSQTPVWVTDSFMENLIIFTNFVVWLTVGLNLIRGIPVLWDGRSYLFAKEIPREIKEA
ncbi:CDP-alcohol phosphatidyltransferase family protein [candidate division KSB1 bacterium]|nr:CDP-alcohol phosphatidyltransferase family protein [candidate division KSB1 bacterium]